MLRLQFTVFIHDEDADLVEKETQQRRSGSSVVRNIIERETESYLFEDGAVHFATAKNKLPRDTLVGTLNCHENIENAWVLIRALRKVCQEVPGCVVRVIDAEQGTDFLFEETMNDDEEEEEHEPTAISALLFDDKLAVARNCDDLTAVRLLRTGQVSEFKDTDKRTGIRYDRKRLTRLDQYFRDFDKLVKHSAHIARVKVPSSLAFAIHHKLESKDKSGAAGSFRHLVPRAALAYAEEDFMDDPLQRVVKALQEMPATECMVRFTRLSYAALLSKCNRKHVSVGDALTEGFARLIRHNDEFETQFARYRAVLEKKGYFAKAMDTTTIAQLEERAREILFAGKSLDEAWLSPRNLRNVLLGSSLALVSFRVCESDPDDWLNANDNADEDDERAWNRVGREMKRFVEECGKDDTVPSESVAHSFGSSARGTQSTQPISFSSAQFFKILGKTDVDEDDHMDDDD